MVTRVPLLIGGCTILAISAVLYFGYHYSYGRNRLLSVDISRPDSGVVDNADRNGSFQPLAEEGRLEDQEPLVVHSAHSEGESFVTAAQVGTGDDQNDAVDTSAAWPMNQEQAQEYLDWAVKRDMVTTDEDKYGNFTGEQLQKLARDGDAGAMRRLGDLAIEAGAVEEGLKHYTLSVAHGSIGAIGRVKMFYIDQLTKASTARDKEAISASKIELMAWHSIAVERGEFLMSHSDFDRWMIGDASIKTIERSGEIHTTLLKVRQEAGLGEFDNTRPSFLDE